MDAPSVDTKIVGRITLTWDDPPIQIVATRLRTMRYSADVLAHIAVAVDMPTLSGAILTRGSWNCCTLQPNIDRELQSVVEGIPWREVMNQAGEYIAAAYRAGEPLKMLGGGNAPAPRFALFPYVPLGEPCIFYGEPESCKSYLATLLAIIAALGWDNNPLGITLPEGPLKPLYLDYETTAATLNWRISRLLNGLGLPKVEIPYRRCERSFTQEADTVRDLLAESGAKLIIVDSIGPACGNEDLNQTGPAQDLFNTIRALKVSSILIGHVPKDRPVKGRTVYGNYFFWARTRGAVEVRASGEEGSDERSIALYHRKANDTTRFKPRGLKFLFDGDQVRLEPQDPRQIPELVRAMSCPVKILAALREGVQLTIPELVDVVEEKDGTVRTNLWRLMRDSKVVKIRGTDPPKYALAARDEPDEA